jgi:hypothetical protein
MISGDGRAQTQSAHCEAREALSGKRHACSGSLRGGGIDTLEALRVGAGCLCQRPEAGGSLLNKVVLEYIPKLWPTLAGRGAQVGGVDQR